MADLNIHSVRLGTSSDLTKNFIISVPAVPDGTLTITRESGAAVASIDAGGKWTFAGGVVLPSNNLTVYSPNVTPLPGVASLLTYTHGLGVVPSECSVELMCLTADLGYAVGDVVEPLTWTAAATATSFTPRRTLTLVEARTGAYSGFAIVNSAGTYSAPTAANWAYRFKLRTA